MGNNPCVSIGLPVFNGENYLRKTLNSLLEQTYSDFELIISDNASTDATPDICQQFASKDRRIRYIRNKINVGSALNFNRLVELSLGKYFKWAAHDDLCGKDFLKKCVGVLDRDPYTVLCYSRTKEIDKDGNVNKYYRSQPNLYSSKSSKRFYECICTPHPQIQVFGLIRMNTLKMTRLIGHYSSSDRILLGELSLRGRFYEIQDFLFYKRDHAKQHLRVYPTRHLRQEWYNPKRAGKITFPHWRLFLEHFISVNRVPLKFVERSLCYIYLVWWMRLHWKYLTVNLILKEPRESS